MTTKNLRELLNVKGEYHTFNREERNYAALLYHFLLKPNGLHKFLDSIKQNFDPDFDSNFDLKDVRIFFEYAHARDLWYEFKAAAKKEPGFDTDRLNEKLRSVIVSLVDPTESLGLPKDVLEFNKLFGAKSTNKIQMPGRWSKLKFPEWVELRGREFAERACTLIWAFNAKADLVIHTGENRAICIEAKVVSAESSYKTSAGKDDPHFERSQTHIQRFILEKLLGYDETTFVFLSVNGNEGITYTKYGEKSINLSWGKVFERMDLAEMDRTEELPFVQESLKFLKSPAIAKSREK